MQTGSPHTTQPASGAPNPMQRLEEMGRELDGKATRPRRARGGANRKLKFAVIGVGALVVMALFGLLYGTWRVGQIERVDLADVLAPTPDSGPTWLIVGSDSRAGIDPDRPDAGGLIGEPVYGERADAIILVRDIPGVGVQMLSLPRDLWIDPPGDNNATRINGAYNDGPAALVELISTELGIPIHRYADVNLAGLDDVVDAVGSVTMNIPNPGYDDSIGLRIDQAGEVTLDGATALAYVRTRKWTEIIDGVERYDPTGDLGRNQRQQAFLRALGNKLASIRNPFTLNGAVSGIVGAVRVDSGAGMGDMYSLARMLQTATQAEPLPVVDHITSGGAYVLLLGDGADAVLANYR
ncbi:MAG: LCP family protein [Acidimicrobiales bacterium]